MLNKRHISQPSRQFVDDPEWGVVVTAVLGAGSCFAIQVSLWGLGRMGSSGQAVIRLSQWSLRVAPCLPVSADTRWEGSCRRKLSLALQTSRGKDSPLLSLSCLASPGKAGCENSLLWQGFLSSSSVLKRRL